MNNFKDNRIINFSIKYYSFFLYAGFYIGLELILISGFSELSRFYSVPIRAVFVVLLAIVINANKRIVINRNAVLLFTLFIFYILKVIYSANLININLYLNWYEYILYFIIYCITTFLFFSNIDVKEKLGTIVSTILFSGFILSIVTIFLFKDYLGSGVGRISMISYDTEFGLDKSQIISPLALAYAAALNLSLLIPYYRYFSNKSKMRKAYLLLNGILSLVIFSLGSTRGALVALILSILYYLMITKGARIRNFIIIAIATPIFLFVLELTGSNLMQRTSSAIESGDSSGRDTLWSDAINEFVNNPFFGGSIEVSGFYPHNIFLEVAMGMGIIGIILFLTILIRSIRRVNIMPRQYSTFIIIFFINAISQHMFTGAFWGSILLFFSLGLMNADMSNLNLENKEIKNSI